SDHLTFEGQKQKVHSLVEKVYSRKNLTLAWERVRANRGAGGYLLSGSREAIHESGMRENCTFRLSGGRRRALQWAPPPTRHRHTLGLKHADHLFDLFFVELDPGFLAKLIEAVRRARAFLRYYDRRRITVVGGIVRRQFVIRRLGCAIGLRGGFCA